MKKKLLIFALFILGIGGYWLSQNMWVFEKKLSYEDYTQKIVGIWQKTNYKDFTSENITEFYSNGHYEVRTNNRSGNGEKTILKGEFNIIDDKLLINYYKQYNNSNGAYDKSIEEIEFFSKSYLRKKQIEPIFPGGSSSELYIKIK